MSPFLSVLYKFSTYLNASSILVGMLLSSIIFLHLSTEFLIFSQIVKSFFTLLFIKIGLSPFKVKNTSGVVSLISHINF
ncbi:hypothetical protein FACS189459_4620 [Bacilli bacterium]|nr:hypothetical protein FACS189459_4620 [Bacilli bacterium]GHU53481.1 hypothetical protein FACS189496_4870 [Bacilli bacterium]